MNAPSNIFQATPMVRKKQRREQLAKYAFLAMALAMILPLVMILGYLVYQALPILSWEFLAWRRRRSAEGGTR